MLIGALILTSMLAVCQSAPWQWYIRYPKGAEEQAAVDQLEDALRTLRSRVPVDWTRVPVDQNKNAKAQELEYLYPRQEQLKDSKEASAELVRSTNPLNSKFTDDFWSNGYDFWSDRDKFGDKESDNIATNEGGPEIEITLDELLSKLLE